MWAGFPLYYYGDVEAGFVGLCFTNPTYNFCEKGEGINDYAVSASLD